MSDSEEKIVYTRRSIAPAIAGAVAGFFAGAGTNLVIPELQGWYRSIGLAAQAQDVVDSNNTHFRAWVVTASNDRLLIEKEIRLECTFIMPAGHESLVGKKYMVQWQASSRVLLDAVFGTRFESGQFWSEFTSDPAVVHVHIPALKPGEWVKFYVYTDVDVRTVHISARSETTHSSLRSEYFASDIKPGSTPIPNPEATPQ